MNDVAFGSEDDQVRRRKMARLIDLVDAQ